jgi:hypothetical protein
VPAPQFGAADRPRDIVDGSGRWLAEQFGCHWVKSRGQVEFRDGPQLLQLGLQSSRYSRAGLAQSALPFSTEALGWLARVRGLADPREFPEPAHEEAAPA